MGLKPHSADNIIRSKKARAAIAGRATWVHWQKFTEPTDSGRIGPGCDGGEGGQHA